MLRQKVDTDRAYHSIGTLSGGNHFIEANKDDDGNIYIVVHSGSRSTLDECPMAYKGMEDIVGNIEPTVTVDAVIRPVYNFKAGEGD